MEWMLQVVDEVDDAIGAVKHLGLGFGTAIGLALAAGLAVAAWATAVAVRLATGA